MPNVEILAVGTELLLGQLVDTNTPHIAGALAAIGIDVYASHTVGDNRARIAAAVRGGLERCDGIVTTGGLGPTVDDLTKEAVCDALELDTQPHQPSLDAMAALLGVSGASLRENNRKQALLPEGAIVLENPHGTAPGYVALRGDGKFVASMPGVPREMKPMLAAQLLPWLRSRFKLRDAIWTRVLHTIGIGESEIDHRIDDLFRRSVNPKIAVLAHGARCDVKIMAKAQSSAEAEALIEPIEAEIAQRLHGNIFGRDAQTLEGTIHELLQRSGRIAAVAESCTGGLISAALAGVPGASQSFAGGIVAYDNTLKRALLGVGDETLERFGAVSEATVREMAQGARAACGSDIALATTGIAGPAGGTAEKPVGLVWLGIAGAQDTAVKRLQLRGDRAAIQARATVGALGFLWTFLSSAER